MLPFRFFVNGCRIVNAPLVFILKIENEDLKLKVLTRASLENLFSGYNILPISHTERRCFLCP
jgi:hypothetical protein